MCASAAPSSARAGNIRLADHDPRPGAESGDQPAQRVGFQRNASGGRRKAWPRHMDEHGAAPAGDPGPGVVVELDNEVVEGVLTLEPVAWLAGVEPDRPVVAPASGILAPAVRRRDRAD